MKSIYALVEQLEARGDNEQQIIGYLMGVIHGESRMNKELAEHIDRQAKFLEIAAKGTTV